MITLNLVPEAIKKQVKTKEYFAVLARVSNTLVMLTVTIALILFSSSWFMHKHYNYQLERASAVNTTSVSYEKQVTEINTLLSDVIKVQEDYFKYTHIIKLLMGISNSGIKLSTVNISSKTGSIEIRGNALTRDELLSFHELMEKDKNFDKIDFPKTNILQRENISFTIKANITIFDNEKN